MSLDHYFQFFNSHVRHNVVPTTSTLLLIVVPVLSVMFLSPEDSSPSPLVRLFTEHSYLTGNLTGRFNKTFPSSGSSSDLSCLIPLLDTPSNRIQGSFDSVSFRHWKDSTIHLIIIATFILVQKTQDRITSKVTWWSGRNRLFSCSILYDLILIQDSFGGVRWLRRY